jgi:hypothetical protein
MKTLYVLPRDFIILALSQLVRAYGALVSIAQSFLKPTIARRRAP